MRILSLLIYSADGPVSSLDMHPVYGMEKRKERYNYIGRRITLKWILEKLRESNLHSDRLWSVSNVHFCEHDTVPHESMAFLCIAVILHASIFLYYEENVKIQKMSQ
jgi:hypothetical protein